jgi:hypothetical protein
MFQRQHAKVVRVEISIGADDSERTIDEFIDDIQAVLGQGTKVHANYVTVQGGYYLIDGKVCLPADYDPQEKDRKPGTYPPIWAGGPSEAERAKPTFQAPKEEAPREFVRVRPTQARRDPITGVKPRKPRSDKGVAKGPRNVPEAKAS